MYVDLNQLFVFAVIIPWFGVTAILFSRFRAKQRAYYRQFPPEQGMSLDMPPGSKIFYSDVRRASYRTMLQRQTDPALEQFRRAVWRRYVLTFLWGFGYPLLMVAMIVFLGVSGLIHYQ